MPQRPSLPSIWPMTAGLAQVPASGPIRSSRQPTALEHRAHLDVENPRGLHECLVHQLRHIHSLERVLAEPGHGRLLLGPALELGLGELAIGDIRHHPVPAHAPLGVGHERGFVAHPDHPAVAMTHAVFVGYRRLEKLVLAREHAVAVVGMHLAGPQAGIRASTPPARSRESP